MKLKDFVKNNEIQSDELGRAVIHDANLLEKINGAVLDASTFLIADTACGNDNCVC